MCLSSVYVQEEKERKVIVEEASRVLVNADGDVAVSTLFGERKEIHGFRIAEVDFLKNYIILERVGDVSSRRTS